jgi:hypothetical protein
MNRTLQSQRQQEEQTIWEAHLQEKGLPPARLLPEEEEDDDDLPETQRWRSASTGTVVRKKPPRASIGMGEEVEAEQECGDGDTDEDEDEAIPNSRARSASEALRFAMKPVSFKKQQSATRGFKKQQSATRGDRRKESEKRAKMHRVCTQYGEFTEDGGEVEEDDDLASLDTCPRVYSESFQAGLNADGITSLGRGASSWIDETKEVVAETKKDPERAQVTEKMRSEAEEQAKKGAEEQAKKEVEEQAKKEAEEQAKKKEKRRNSQALLEKFRRRRSREYSKQDMEEEAKRKTKREADQARRAVGDEDTAAKETKDAAVDHPPPDPVPSKRKLSRTLSNDGRFLFATGTAPAPSPNDLGENGVEERHPTRAEEETETREQMRKIEGASHHPHQQQEQESHPPVFVCVEPSCSRSFRSAEGLEIHTEWHCAQKQQQQPQESKLAAGEEAGVREGGLKEQASNKAEQAEKVARELEHTVDREEKMQEQEGSEEPLTKTRTRTKTKSGLTIQRPRSNTKVQPPPPGAVPQQAKKLPAPPPARPTSADADGVSEVGIENDEPLTKTRTRTKTKSGLTIQRPRSNTKVQPPPPGAAPQQAKKLPAPPPPPAHGK